VFVTVVERIVPGPSSVSVSLHSVIRTSGIGSSPNPLPVVSRVTHPATLPRGTVGVTGLEVGVAVAAGRTGAGVGAVVGSGVGSGVGSKVGSDVGPWVGSGVGIDVGSEVGDGVAAGRGAIVGSGVGELEGGMHVSL